MNDSQPSPGSPPRSPAERMLAAHYQDIRGIAHRILDRDRASALLQPTELVHEAAMRLMKLERIDWKDSAHFLATAARLLRQALLDEIRRAAADKRRAKPLMTVWPDAAPEESAFDFEALDRALTKLEAISPERARIVELRFFAGLSTEEIADVQGVSSRTVKRQWQVARIWLMTELGSAST